MKYRDLRDFIAHLESTGQLIRVKEPVSPVLEMTEFCDRLLTRGGPAVLFENVPGYTTPVLFEHAGRKALLVWGADHLTAHDAASGKVLWSCGGFNPQPLLSRRSLAK